MTNVQQNEPPRTPELRRVGTVRELFGREELPPAAAVAARKMLDAAIPYGRALRRWWRDAPRVDWLISTALHIGGDFADRVFAEWNVINDGWRERRVIDVQEAHRLFGCADLTWCVELPGFRWADDHGDHMPRRLAGLRRLAVWLRAACPEPPTLPLVVASARETSSRLLTPRTEARIAEDIAQHEAACARVPVIDLAMYRKHVAPRMTVVRRERSFGKYRIVEACR